MKKILFLILIFFICSTLSFSESYKSQMNSEFQDFMNQDSNTSEKVTKKQPIKIENESENSGQLISGQIEEAKKYGLVDFVVQVGAFKNLDSAVNLVKKLNKYELDAFYFYDKDKLFKVRFGNYASDYTAKKIADDLKQRGIIGSYKIVSPETYEYVKFNKYKDKEKTSNSIRDLLVKTVKRHIGIPYKWGGTSVKTGFDCSGLMMVTYKMNGFIIPRNSRMQYKKGKKISKSELRKGDLVFFATGSNRYRITHVGMYIGNGKFVHAPGRGKRVRIASLNNSYFKKRYIGAVTYL
jgi:cell wall-associated NlpC family hydrolase